LRLSARQFGFKRNLVRDILSFPAFSDATIALMDVDPERLSYIKRAVDYIVTEGKYPARIIATRTAWRRSKARTACCAHPCGRRGRMALRH
jgi:hypothetical protein